MNHIVGTTLNGRYTLTERIAMGGMGEVWSAADTILGRTVAVKLLHPALSQESDVVERFRDEARHSASLHHPNIATVFDFGEDQGEAYLVMELVAGQPLSQIIAERAPLSASETASILAQAASALQAAHQGGVIHRDVKPANILITPHGTAKLTDFGISRAIDTAPLTQTGQVLGTAQYLSPEQALGQSATASSDIYSLGVVGHEMLTGARPFDLDTVVATALAHVNQPPPPLPDSVPVGVRDVINAALAKDPADRPASAAAVAEALGMPGAALAPAEDSVPTAAAPTQAMPSLTQAMPVQAILAQPSVGLPTRRSRLRPQLVLAAAVVVILLGIVSAFAWSASDGSDGLNTPQPTTSIPATPTPTSTSTPSAKITVAPPVTTSASSQPSSGKDGDHGKKKGK